MFVYKNKMRFLSLAAGAALFAPAVAKADLVLNIEDLGNSAQQTFTTSYPSLTPGVGVSVYTPGPSVTIGQFNITSSSGYALAGAGSYSGAGYLSFEDISITNTGSSTDTLQLTLGANDFPSAGNPGGGLSLTDGISGNVTDGTLNLSEQSYANSANIQNGEAGPGITTLPPLMLNNFTAGSSPESFSLNYIPPAMGSGFTSLYSLTNVVDVNLTPAGNAHVFQVNGEGDTLSEPTEVPEPSAAVLLGAGGLTLLLRRKTGCIKTPGLQS